MTLWKLIWKGKFMWILDGYYNNIQRHKCKNQNWGIRIPASIFFIHEKMGSANVPNLTNLKLMWLFKKDVDKELSPLLKLKLKEVLEIYKTFKLQARKQIPH